MMENWRGCDQTKHKEDIRIFNLMDVFMFWLSDLNILYGHNIHVGDGNEYLEEGMLF
ncbi:hypothetical protein Hanom_Chr09g00780001 [Helianthus anomalus]